MDFATRATATVQSHCTHKLISNNVVAELELTVFGKNNAGATLNERQISRTI